MKKKILLSIGVLVLSISAVFANTIIVHMSCGITAGIDSDDYEDTYEMLNAVSALNRALCPEE